MVSEASGVLLSWASDLVGRLPGILLFLATTVLAAYFTAVSYPTIIAFIRRQVPQRWQGTLSAAARTMRSTFWKWLKAESLLCLITFSLLLAAFLYLKIDAVHGLDGDFSHLINLCDILHFNITRHKIPPLSCCFSS